MCSSDLTDEQQLAEIVLAEDLRLQHIVEDLLLLTRMDEGTVDLRRREVDLDDIVFEEAARLRASAGDLRVDTSKVSSGRVRGDESHLDRLVRNLIENAGRHAHTKVALSLRETNGEVVLTVDDDGEGIAPDDRDRIFDRFLRLQDARDRDSGGTGLGLAIVREIANAHSATVSVRNAPKGGARLEVRFPSLDL